MTRTITVKGIGNVSARPDYVTVTMDIESVWFDYELALRDAASKVEEIQDAAVSVGYEKTDVKTTSFNVDTRYESYRDKDGNYKREFKGYACSYRLKLSFDFDNKQLAKVLTALANCKARPEMRVAFTVKDASAVSEALLVSATENARAKAEILCHASCAQLGDLLTIDYNWGEMHLFSPTSYEVEESCVKMKACAAPDIEPEDIKVFDTVAFVWEIK